MSVVVLAGTWSLLRDSLTMSLDAVPAGIDPDHVHSTLAALEGVSRVHDLHIWGLSTTETALTVHLVKPEAQVDDDWLHTIAHELHDRFGIVHVTIQVETGRGEHTCRLAPDDVV